MNLPFRLFLSTLFALTIAFAYNFFFLHLFERPITDQILLIVFSTAALGFLIFSFLGDVAASVKPEIPLAAKKKFNGASILSFLRENIYGIALALIFFAVYTTIGLKINVSNRDTTDNYLDADNYSWAERISAPDGHNFEMRGPHPFAYFIFRPLGWLLNLFTRNYGLSAILLNTLVGASCVFMAWIFIKQQFQDPVYALLIASLLGLSTAHIFFGSVVETYIFSAAALIGFVLILQKRTNSMSAPVAMSVVTFGITITNFVQNFIGFSVSLFEHRPGEVPKTFRVSLNKIFRFTALTLSFGIVISLIHAAWYPSSKLFFLLADAQAEEEFTFSIFQEPTWRAMGRAMLLVRTILLYAVIAPRPYVFGSEVGGTFPRFNFFKIAPETFSYSSYNGLGNVLVLAWVILVLAAILFFLWNIIRTRKVDLSLALGLCVLFNFALHLNYGYEPFLYSPDWAYALIFFVALSLGPLAKNRFFQSGLLVFLILLAYNQFQFFEFIFETIAPFIRQGG
jgi:hypothetical protein